MAPDSSVTFNYFGNCNQTFMQIQCCFNEALWIGNLSFHQMSYISLKCILVWIFFFSGPFLPSLHILQSKIRLFWALIKLHCICKLQHVSNNYIYWDCQSSFYSYMAMVGHVVSISLSCYILWLYWSCFCVALTNSNCIMIKYFMLFS